MNKQVINVVQQIRQGQNPQQLMLNMLQQTNNPISANLFSLAQQGKTKEIEQVARNIMRQQGKDFDTEFRAFRQTLGL